MRAAIAVASVVGVAAAVWALRPGGGPEPDASPEALSERERIEKLLQAVASSQHTFVRNGRDYSGPEAAKHWRRKLDYAGDRIKTAEQFIEQIATKSSMSGKPYKVKIEGGTTVDTRVWLTERLTEGC